MKTYWQNYIDGAWVDGGAGRIDVFNPGTGEKLAEHALADEGDVDRAVMAARFFKVTDLKKLFTCSGGFIEHSLLFFWAQQSIERGM